MTLHHVGETFCTWLAAAVAAFVVFNVVAFLLVTFIKICVFYRGLFAVVS